MHHNTQTLHEKKNQKVLHKNGLIQGDIPKHYKK